MRLSEDSELNKAVVTLDAATHLASVTVWGNGMLEFIALELATAVEANITDRECFSVEELRVLLDDCGASFAALVAPR